MARNNSNFLLSFTFDFNPEDILDKSIQFDLKKPAREKYQTGLSKKYVSLIQKVLYRESRRNKHFLLKAKQKTRREGQFISAYF